MTLAFELMDGFWLVWEISSLILVGKIYQKFGKMNGLVLYKKSFSINGYLNHANSQYADEQI